MCRPDNGAGPVLLADHFAALLAQDTIHAETHDRPEIPEQDAWNGLTRHVPTFASDSLGIQGPQGNHLGNPCRWCASSLAVEHQVDSCAGYFELGDGLGAVGSASQQTVASWRQTVE